MLFDALDHLHPDRGRAEHLASGVLNLAVTLSRQTTRLRRAKVFVHPDMLDGALSGVPRADRGTLNVHAADLSWGRADYLGRRERSDLYGLFFQLLGNRDSAEAAAFRAAWPTWERTEDGRFLAPAELRHDPAVQEGAFTALAGRFMGVNARNGYTYTYLSCYLQDARGTVTPRPFLAALASALLHTEGSHPDHDRPLHHEGLRHGAHWGARPEELDRAMPWVRLTLEPLAGMQLPIEEDDVLALWEKAGLTARLLEAARAAENDARALRTGPRAISSHPQLVEEMISAGVMSRRTGGQLDSYRLAHRMGRRGGVRRAAPAV
ncbi:hypothetical protein AB0D66_22010 [Streptomyces sp. NPDC048270]|uniref:hypothetical protein n=1 Tax=Streptomyces sp. NPDC048270 TaxID=3154615 RepID=UPI0033F82C70